MKACTTSQIYALGVLQGVMLDIILCQKSMDKFKINKCVYPAETGFAICIILFQYDSNNCAKS